MLERIYVFVYLVLANFLASMASFLNLHKTTDFLDFWLCIAPLSIYKYQHDPTLSLQVRCFVKNSSYPFKTLSLLKQSMLTHKHTDFVHTVLLS